MYLAERKDIYEALYPETKHGGTPGKAGGGKKAKTATIATFAKDTAKKTGKAERTVRLKTKIGKTLKSVADKLNEKMEKRPLKLSNRSVSIYDYKPLAINQKRFSNDSQKSANHYFLLKNFTEN